MVKGNFLSPLLETIRDILKWFKDSKVDGIIIGGVAASLLGRPRATGDVDALIVLDESCWGDFLKLGAKFGFKPRRHDVLEFARKARVLLVTHESTGIDADISFGILPFEKEAINRKKWVNISGIRIPLPTPEDLIIMKSVANRARDIADIESIMDANPELDLRRVRRWIKEFAKALEIPEILEDLKRIIKKINKRK